MLQSLANEASSNAEGLGLRSADHISIVSDMAQVFEETGLDIGGRFDERDCVEIWVKHGVSQKRTKLFFVPGIDTSTEFAPQARKVCGPEP